MANEEFEQRWSVIQQQAADIDCDVHVSITIGGVDVTEVYRIRTFPEREGGRTLDNELTDIEAALADPRVRDAATATTRLKRAEDLQKLIGSLVTERLKEYDVAIKAMRSVTTEPPINDVTQEVLAELVSMERDPRSNAEILRDAVNQANAEEEGHSGQEEVPDQGQDA